MPDNKVVTIGGRRKRKVVRKSKEILRKPGWYKMESFFDSDAKQVMEIGGEDVVLAG